jgi:hypothetical protein
MAFQAIEMITGEDRRRAAGFAGWGAVRFLGEYHGSCAKYFLPFLAAAQEV